MVVVVVCAHLEVKHGVNGVGMRGPGRASLRQWNLTSMDCTSCNGSVAVPMREDVTCEDRSVCMSLAATPYLTVYAAAKNSLMSSD